MLSVRSLEDIRFWSWFMQAGLQSQTTSSLISASYLVVVVPRHLWHFRVLQRPHCRIHFSVLCGQGAFGMGVGVWGWGCWSFSFTLDWASSFLFVCFNDLSALLQAELVVSTAQLDGRFPFFDPLTIGVVDFPSLLPWLLSASPSELLPPLSPGMGDQQRIISTTSRALFFLAVGNDF